MASQLFTPITLRDLTFKNRLIVSPMCQYSSLDGMPNDWHLVHLGSRAVGGFGAIIQEATAVTPEGRISPADAGLWNDAQMEAYKPSVQFIRAHGAVAGIQLAHAGRKASTPAPWKGHKALAPSEGGWLPVGPSPLAFDEHSPIPKELTGQEIDQTIRAFIDSAARALHAGYQLVEVHAAHGYLLHEFLSPQSNQRTDQYGGSLENRMRLTLEVARVVRNAWPQDLPVFARISASDWVEGGWDIESSVILCQALKEIGIDLVDVSSGGNLPKAPIPGNTPGYQVPFAEEIRAKAGIATGAVGFITEARQAEEILSSGKADMILMARETLREPYWPMKAAAELGVELDWPEQYGRAKPQAK